METEPLKRPFYFLNCDYKDVGRVWGYSLDTAKSVVNVYGKDASGGTVVVTLKNYEPDFYVSFSDETLTKRVIKEIVKRARDGGKRRDDKYDNRCYIKGMEMARGYSSLIIRREGPMPSNASSYGVTDLRYVFRVYVRCFSHVRAAVREILETASEAAAEEGRSTGRADLERRVRFYESSLDANVRIAERLHLRPCRWSLLDAEVCSRVTTEMTGPVVAYEYDFTKHVDRNAMERRGCFVIDKTPFSEVAELDDLPPPPVSVMSFDIECLANDIEVFPTPDVCSIIQISTVTVLDALNRKTFGLSERKDSTEGALNARRKCLYTVNDCDSFDEDVTVKCFDNECTMLRTFCDDLVADDPDIITGFNIENFDLPFLFARFKHYGLRPKLGRVDTESVCEINDKRSSCTKKFASYIPKSHFTTIRGRTLFDAYVYVRKEFSLRSYKLNAVSEHFLKTQKEDVKPGQIPSLFQSGAAGRAVLGRYCVKDSELVIDLLFKLNAFVNLFERCKVFNTSVAYMMDRGQQVRIMSMLLKWCAERKILVDDCTTPGEVFFNKKNVDGREGGDRDLVRVSRPCKRQILEDGEEDEGGDDDDGGKTTDGARASETKDGGGKTKNTRYDGAVVIEPKIGLYHDPIVCLDYASLYPSIMIAYNLCYSTMLLNTEHGDELEKVGVASRSPVGHYFLNSHVKKGALPSILESLIATRKAVRRRMATLDHTTTDYMLLDGQQVALKLAANSIYGATGCLQGKLYFLHIPSSVTAYGRKMIVETKAFVERTYPDREVIYGDTDSVMVRMTGWADRPGNRLWECADVGTEMAAAVTRLIDRPPIELQFETVYRPFLLANKKRYAAGVYKSLNKVKNIAESQGIDAAEKLLETTKIDINCKGLEVVRRDNCVFAKNTLQKTINMIMDMRRPEDVVDVLRRDVLALLTGSVGTSDLIISKEWTKKTKSATPHDTLAQKMNTRDPGSAPKLGDRVEYLVVCPERGQQSRRLCDRVEDPTYVAKNGLRIDYVYYADNQLMNPLTNVLAIAMPDLTKEEIKDTLWPQETPAGERLPVRPSKKVPPAKRARRNTKHDVAPKNNMLITTLWPQETPAGERLPVLPSKKVPPAKRARRNTKHDVAPKNNMLITSFTVPARIS